MFPLALIAAGVNVVGRIVQGISASSQVRQAGEQARLAAESQARSYARQAQYAAKDILRTGEVQAKNYLTQAAIHERQASLIREKGSYDAARMTETGRKVIGSHIASFAASGIALTGTVADVVRSTGESVAMDIAAARLSTRIGWDNEVVLATINKKNARDTIKYAEEAAVDAIRYGKEAAEDVMKYGTAAAGNANRATAIAFASPVIQGVGEFASTSGIFARG